MPPQLDIASNRAARKYSQRELQLRAAWALGEWLQRFSPHPCFPWRRFVLRCFGGDVGDHVHVEPSTRILFPWNLSLGDWTALGPGVLIYNPGRVLIGTRVTISHRAHLCAGTHDHTRSDMPMLRSPIEIQDQVWLGADSFIGPGVVVGQGAIVGARAVVTKNVAPWTIVAGNPATLIGTRELRDPHSAALDPASALL